MADSANPAACHSERDFLLLLKLVEFISTFIPSATPAARFATFHLGDSSFRISRSAWSQS
jgi:hypothetical protein